MRTADGYIINKCLNGDKAAFGLLIDRYKEGVYALAYSKLGNFHDAEDVAQEVFIKAYKKLHTLKHYDSFHAWLYATTSNLCKDWIRARGRRPDGEYIEDEDPKTLEVLSIEDYREKAAQTSLHESLEEALESLPEMHRQVLTLYYLAGMSGKEIARFLGIAPMAAWQRLSRARSQLKKEMAAMMDTAFEGKRLPGGFTLRIVEAIKRMKIQPMPRTTGLPWGLSAAAGIIITVLSLNPYVNLTKPSDIAAGSPLSVEAKMLETGEISVDILKSHSIPIIFNKQENSDSEQTLLLDSQNALLMSPQAGMGKWIGKAEMPTARCLACSATVNGRIYVFGGGKEREKAFPTVEEYDPATDTWKRKADMPTARGLCSASAVNGKIYVIGGAQGTFDILLTVEEYDPATDTWEKKADMPTARCMLSTSVVNGKIYAIGGAKVVGPGSVLSAVEEYDPATDTWKKKSDTPTARHALGTSVLNGKIYVIGGWTGGSRSSIVEEYDPITDTWIRKAPMPTERDFLSTCEVGGKIYAIGGVDNNIRILSTVEVYDPAADVWMTEDSMPTAKGALCVGAVDGKVYAIGGTTQPLPFLVNMVVWPVLGTVDEYDTGFVPPTQGKAVEFKTKLLTKWGNIK